jgi:non-ribosomal peptide synthetase component F
VPLLPTDRPRPQTATEQKSHVLLPVGPELQADLVAFSRARRLTLFMVVLAAFKAYLHHAADTDDVSVPTQTAGRTRVEVEDTIGFFLNAQLLRTDLGGDPTLDELLSRVRATCLGAYAHELPILMLIDRMPSLSAALADDRYVLMPFQHVQIPLMTDRSRRFGGDCYYANFSRDPARAVLGIALPMDSLFTVRWVGDNMLVSINYSTDLFDEPTVEHMAAEFMAILRQIVRDSSCRLSQLPLAQTRRGGASG